MTGKQARELLGLSDAHLSWYVNQGDLTCYQKVVGRSPHRFDPQEVRSLKIKRERLARIQATNKEFREWHAQRCGKRPSPPRKTDALTEKDLRPDEREIGEWITARQAAALLEVDIARVSQLRQHTRLYRERCPVKKGSKWKVFQFRRADVLTLRDDPDDQRGRLRYRTHCAPEAAIKRETRDCLHTEVSLLHGDTPDSTSRILLQRQIEMTNAQIDRLRLRTLRFDRRRNQNRQGRQSLMHCDRRRFGKAISGELILPFCSHVFRTRSGFDLVPQVRRDEMREMTDIRRGNNHLRPGNGKG